MKKVLVLFIFLSFCSVVYCQIPSTDGTPQETSWVENNGFLLKTQLSATSEYSGVTFTYTIFYTIPPSVDPGTVITITDVIPAPLKVGTASDPNLSVNPVDEDLTTPTTVIYTVPLCNMVQGTYNFQINVKFPPGTSCNGAFVDNYSCMKSVGTAGSLISLQDPGLCTDAITITNVAVENPYQIVKGSVLSYTGPESNPLYQGVVNGDIEYFIQVVWKPDQFYSNGFGLQNLSNVVVTDILPVGASYVPNSFYITYGDPQYNSAIIASVTQTGNILTFVIPFLSYNQWLSQFYYKVHYPEISMPPAPSFPVGSIVENTASFSATSCNTIVTSNTATADVQLNAASYSTGGNSGIGVAINNPVSGSAGCIGYYHLQVQNTGNVPLPDFTMLDEPFPSQVIVTKIIFNSYSWGSYPLPFTLNINDGAEILSVPVSNRYIWENTGNLPVSSIKVDLGSGLSVNGVYAIDIYFAIKDNLLTGTVISNAMEIYFPAQYNIPDINASTSFTIEDSQPKICLKSKVCNQLGAYLYGDIIRFKVALQNIGSEVLNGAKVSDLLSSNFEYIPGSETYYSTMNYNDDCGNTDPAPPALPPPPIPFGATPWSGVTVVQSGQLIEWFLPPTESHCEMANLYYGCGDPSVYYYIEFNVRVKHHALAGSVQNYFTLDGGNLLLPATSNTNYLTVNSVFGAQVQKFVSTDNGVNWSKTAIAVPGSEVMFRLQYKNTANYPVNNVVLVDMLPINYGISDDRMILNRSNANNRGGQFELKYSTSLNSPSGTLPIIRINSVPPNITSTVSVNNDYNICLPELKYSPPGCFSPPVWNSSGTGKNVKFEFGPNINIQPGDELTCDYKVQVPPGTSSNLTTCNSFALISEGYYYIVDQSGSSVIYFVDPLPSESDIACLIVGNITATAEAISDFNEFNISCFGGNNGTAEAFADGGVLPYSYLWNDPASQTTKVATGLKAGTYTVQITDAIGNSVIASCTLTEPTQLTIEAGLDQTVYYGYQPTECATFSWSNVSGGVPPYTVVWNTGQTTQSITVCPTFTTIYTVTIMDANNCTFSDQVEACVLDIRCGNGNNFGHKVELCHFPPGNPNNPQTICIDKSAVPAHLAHTGDHLGACGIICTGLKSSFTIIDKPDPQNEISLEAYPNPFSGIVTISFTCPVEGNVKIKLIDYAGMEKALLFEKKVEKDFHYMIELDGSLLSQGLYFCVFQHSDGTVKLQKLIYTR